MEYEKIGRWSSDKLGHNYTARAIDNIGRILAKVGADVDIVFENPDEVPLAHEQKRRIETMIDETLDKIVKIRHKGN
ncbi:MAG: hypothetical protein KAJ07_11075 [Planctomycetes bacterium]|nr:hypothetical protein [Planctomycetota bacterium]